MSRKWGGGFAAKLGVLNGLNWQYELIGANELIWVGK